MKCEYLRKHGDNHMIISMNQIGNISSNFYKVDKNRLKRLPREILPSIIKNEQLKLENEDSLIKFINELRKEEEESIQSNSYVEFYEEIHFSCLLEDKLKEFTYRFDINKIAFRLWSMQQ